MTKKTYIFRSPVQFIKETPGLNLVPISILKIQDKLDELEFSANTQFLLSLSGKNVSIYDADKLTRKTFEISDKIDTKTEIQWMDGHRLTYRSIEGKIKIVGYQGNNLQELVSTQAGDSAFFDRDYEVLHTITSTNEAKTEFSLMANHMRTQDDR